MNISKQIRYVTSKTPRDIKKETKTVTVSYQTNVNLLNIIRTLFVFC